MTSDAQILAEAAKADLAGRPPPTREFRHSPPAVRCIDCVLSLRRKYNAFVVPRVREFVLAHPDVQQCAQLADYIRSFQSPLEFMTQVLRFNSGDRASALLGVVERLDELAGAYPGASEVERLESWAQTATARQSATFGVKFFGIAGYQYLRILFGANTVKPDVHIARYVGRVLGRSVDDLTMVELVESAAKIGGWSADCLDGMIWEREAN